VSGRQIGRGYGCHVIDGVLDYYTKNIDVDTEPVEANANKRTPEHGTEDRHNSGERWSCRTRRGAGAKEDS